ncbi:MAG TPA: outer membrane beta-barrel protein [Planctomycetota bacterium]|nr:outer membrane beta-barrel protein [Planctomycetota bacterium]
MTTRLSLTSTLLLLTASLSAADLRYTDIRVGVGIGAGPDEADVDYDAGDRSAAPSGRGDVELDGDVTGRLRVGVVHGRATAWGGWYVGGGLELGAGRLDISSATGDEDFDDTSFNVARVYAEVGYVYAFNDRLHLEVGPTGSVGVVSTTWIDQDDAGRWESETGGGASFAYGARVGVYGRIGRGFILGVSGGIERSESEAEVEFEDGSEGDADVRLVTTGAYGSAEFGWRF